MAMYKQVDPLPIGSRYYYKSERVQVIDYHQPNPLFAREYIIASLVTGETRRVFRNELLRTPIDYPPSTIAPENELENLFAEEMVEDCPADETINMINSTQQRFVKRTETDLCQLENARVEATTAKQTMWAVKLFKDWLSEKKRPTNFEEIGVDDLAKDLRCFYAEARTKNGEQYSKSALISIRAGINRHLTSPPYSRPLNIMRDREFMAANHVMTGIVKTLKREGADKTKHHPSISEGDLQKMYSSEVLSNKTPTTLVRKVWFEIMLHFCRRGREGLRHLSSTSFLLSKDDSDKEFYTMAYNEADKTHHGVDSRESLKDTRMYAMPNSELCPVKSLKLYLRKRNPKNDAFFQRPLTNFNPSSDVWFFNAPVGHNTLGCMMSTISKAAGLSRIYTNHCVRATTATVLAHAGVSSVGIMSVTGHRNEQSIKSYVNAPSIAQRRQYSETLQQVATGQNNDNSFSSLAPCSSSSVAVREVSESTMLGGGSLFCGSTFHVSGGGQLHINVYPASAATFFKRLKTCSLRANAMTSFFLSFLTRVKRGTAFHDVTNLAYFVC